MSKVNPTHDMATWVETVDSQRLTESVTYTLKAIVACMRNDVPQEDEDVYWEDLAIILNQIAKTNDEVQDD